jgi:transposase
LIQERADEVNRVQKVLEGANIKLASVATDVLGVSGRAMLEAMVQGVDDPDTLAGLAKGRLRKKQSELSKALQGIMGAHQRMMLKSQLRHIDFLDEEIKRLDCEINDRMKPYQKELDQLDQIPGLGRRNGQEILAYIGVDMSRFLSDAHLASWSRICPGNDSSAGKRRSGRTGKGNPVLHAALIEAAWAAIRKKDCFLSALYHKIAVRRGKKRAIVAVGHRILVIIYHMLRDGSDYRELGAQYISSRQREAAIRRAVNRLQQLGVGVTLQIA